jgi:PKD repeat protein
LSIAPWFPQGRNYIFVCDPTFEATSFTWYFGDGQMQLNSANDDVFHTYANAGEYLVSCTATDGNNTGSDTLAVTIDPLENETVEEPPVDPQDPVCYNSVYDADVVCNGGEITQDLQVGCRKVTCASEDASLTVLACNKPNEAQRTYFEMYRQAWSGNGLSICLGQTCISNNGYAMGQLPICTDAPEELPVEEEQPPEQPLESGVADLHLAPWFPQERNVVLVCDNTVENAVFDWNFGDGQKQIGVAHDNVWHTYESDGLYETSCTARNATVTASDTLDVPIGGIVFVPGDI